MAKTNQGDQTALITHAKNVLHRHDPSDLKNSDWPIDLVSRLIDALEGSQELPDDAYALLRSSAMYLDNNYHEEDSLAYMSITELMADIDQFLHQSGVDCSLPRSCLSCQQRKISGSRPR